MRTVTYNAGAYLIEDLVRSGVVAHIHHDGGDIILLELRAGQRVSIHLIESAITLSEIRQTLEDNTRDGIYTLFILWSDRMLPSDGHRQRADDWMAALFTLYGDRIYAYDIYGAEIFVFPVHFDGYGLERTARFGSTVQLGNMLCEINKTSLNGFSGVWRVAGFGTRQHQAPPKADPVLHTLERCYALLGVDADSDKETIRKAYRLLARRYHPDLNRSPDATLKMQQINEAYDKVMAQSDIPS